VRTAFRAAAAFLSGAIGLAVGVGLGLPYLAKTGFSTITVVGMTTLVAGLVLAGAGSAALVRATPGWWRALTAPVLFLAAVVTLYTLGQAVAFTHVPPTTVGERTPADLGVAYREVEFPSADGVDLSGWYLPSTNGAAVVLLHGSGSTRSAVLDHAVVLAGHGYGVLPL
jgi:uncharacterized protein